MELPVVIEPLPDRSGFKALLVPFNLSATAETAEEAHRQVAALLQERIHEGMELRIVNVPTKNGARADCGWLPDDELTREWIQHMEAYRAECDAADRARILGEQEEDAP